ncbi:hypothetical protein DITRI_Ditri11bG0131400 [Diplodiscus trichospermus]
MKGLLPFIIVFSFSFCLRFQGSTSLVSFLLTEEKISHVITGISLGFCFCFVSSIVLLFSCSSGFSLISDEMNCCSCNDIVGYGFRPTDKELIDHYLLNKALGRDYDVQAIGEIDGDFCDWVPEELSRFSVRESNYRYFFYRRNHSKGVKRTGKLGSWKLTGKHRSIKANVGIGTKKTLVFYEGCVRKRKWTPWVIHEYTLPDTLPNQNGYFLCKLKRKDDKKPGISSFEEGQPSNVADDKNFDSSLEINVDELLALLGESNGTNEVEDEAASVQKPQNYGEQQPSCDAASFLYNLNDDLEGVRNQSSTNEQMHGEHVSFELQSHIHEEHVTYQNDLSFLCGSHGNSGEIQHQSSTNELQHQSSTNEQSHEIQHQSSTNEQSYEIQHQSSSNEQNHEIQHQSSTNEQSHEIQHQSSTNEEDEFWNNIFVNDYDTFLDDGGNGLFVGSDSCNMLVDRYLPIESSRKRPRIDNGGLNDARETEVSQEQYGHALGTSSMLIHADSNMVLAMSSVEAPDDVLFAVEQNRHSSEKWWLDILQENDLCNKVRDIEEHATAMDIPQKGQH